jgi:hypothetical protein
MMVTGDLAPIIRSAVNFEEATRIVSGMRHSINGSQSEKIEFTIKYDDGFSFSGTSKIELANYADFRQLASATIRSYLSEDPNIREMVDRTDPTAQRRAAARDLAGKYDFGSWLNHIDSPSIGMKI